MLIFKSLAFIHLINMSRQNISVNKNFVHFATELYLKPFFDAISFLLRILLLQLGHFEVGSAVISRFYDG